MTDITHSYKGKELTAQQAWVVCNFTRRLQKSLTQQKDLGERLTAAHKAFVLGNALRHERGLTEDQDTEWGYPCGKIRLQQLSDAIDSLQCETRNYDTDISQITFQLQRYIDSLPLPVVVPASEAPHGHGEDVASPYSTCCPGGEQDTSDSSSSDDEDGDA